MKTIVKTEYKILVAPNLGLLAKEVNDFKEKNQVIQIIGSPNSDGNCYYQAVECVVFNKS